MEVEGVSSKLTLTLLLLDIVDDYFHIL